MANEARLWLKRDGRNRLQRLFPIPDVRSLQTAVFDKTFYLYRGCQWSWTLLICFVVNCSIDEKKEKEAGKIQSNKYIRFATIEGFSSVLYMSNGEKSIPGQFT